MTTTTQTRSGANGDARVASKAADVLRRAEEDGVEFIRFWFTDILGQLKSFAVGREELEGALEDGMGFDGSSITGFNRIEESDMVAMPDPETYVVLPWRDDGGSGQGNVARMFCDVLRPGGEPYEGDPRYVMRRALARMEELGFDHYYLGPELEYFYFADDQLSEEGLPKIIDKGGYFDLTTLDAASDLRRSTVNALKAVGIPVEYTHHEVGPSQHEIDMRFADGLRMCDSAMTYRIVVKEIAHLHDVYATFMPKPLFGENGSGMHTHQSLFSGERNAFFDADGHYHLSDTARSFIAGLLKHAREIAALFAPNVNSYKRLVPGYEAPVYVAWSQRNRSALVRVPMYQPGKERATRCELRCPDPSCNPYLTFAAMLHAGLEGIEKGYDIPEPMETNLYDLSHDEREARGIEQLPETLGEAIEVLAGSDLVRKALGDHIFERYVELKREEWEEYRVQVTRWELERYLPVL
jgi:glutamine synthetase